MQTLLVRVLVMAVVTVGLLGCGQSVDAARADALAQVDGMVFLDDAATVRQGLVDAESVEQVAKIMNDAALENADRAETYWGCADKAASALGRSSWQANAWHPDGAWDEVVLRLEDAGVAALDRVASHLPAGPGSRPTTPPTRLDGWLLENVGKVEGWSSDAANLASSRTLLGDQPPSFSSSGGACIIWFNLTLHGAGSESSFVVEMSFTSAVEPRYLHFEGKSLTGKWR